jgi:nucleosome binding factor SPN SPT16 subunit
MVDVALPFAKLFAVKDEKEVELMKRSAHGTVNAWNYLRRKIVDIVDMEKVFPLIKVKFIQHIQQRIKQSALSDDVDKAMVSVEVQGDLAKVNSLETCYGTIVQSGENCQLKFSVYRLRLKMNKVIWIHSSFTPLVQRSCSNLGPFAACLASVTMYVGNELLK